GRRLVESGLVAPVDRYVRAVDEGAELERVGIDRLDASVRIPDPHAAVGPCRDTADGWPRRIRDGAVDDALIGQRSGRRIDGAQRAGAARLDRSALVPIGARFDVPEDLRESAVVAPADPDVPVQVDGGAARVVA